MTRSLKLLAIGILASACSQPVGPPLTVSDVVVLEPLAGSGIAAGYLVLENHTDLPITIEKITSPVFASVEMHETVIQDDIARMTSLASLVIERQSAVVFEPGGKHLMMFDASREIAAGVPVTLEFHDSANGLLTVATTVRSRAGLQE